MKKMTIIGLLWGIAFSPLLSHSQASTVNIPVTTIPTNFDPQNLEGVVQMFVDTQIHAGLFRYRPNLDTEKDLVKDFHFTNGNKTLVVELGERTFSDGKRILAADVIKTFKRMFLNRSGMSSDLGYIVGSEKLIRGEDAKDFGVAALWSAGAKLDSKSMKKS